MQWKRKERRKKVEEMSHSLIHIERKRNIQREKKGGRQKKIQFFLQLGSMQGSEWKKRANRP